MLKHKMSVRKSSQLLKERKKEHYELVVRESRFAKKIIAD
jgi:hypothetical protein